MPVFVPVDEMSPLHDGCSLVMLHHYLPFHQYGPLLQINPMNDSYPIAGRVLKNDRKSCVE